MKISTNFVSRHLSFTLLFKRDYKIYHLRDVNCIKVSSIIIRLVLLYLRKSFNRFRQLEEEL